MTEKITKKQYFDAVMDVLNKADSEVTYGEKGITIDAMQDFVKHEVELLSRKNAGKSVKPSKSAMETAEVAQVILDNMPMDTPMTPTMIIQSIPALTGKSNQRVTSALKVLMAAKLVTNDTGKNGKTLYTKVGE